MTVSPTRTPDADAPENRAPRAHGGEGAGLCRISVVGEGRRADLAVPETATVAALLPVLLRHLEVATTGPRDPHWVLQRLGEGPLDPEGTPESLGLRHGDVLHLRPGEDPLPEPDFDDLADGVAHVLGTTDGRWRPDHTRRLFTVLAGIGLAALAAVLVAEGPGLPTALACATAAAVLAVAAATRGRTAAEGSRAAATATGAAAVALATLAGLAATGPAGGGPAGLLLPDRAGVLAAAAPAAVTAAVLLAVGAPSAAVLGTLLALA
ncbi:EsaB/YukD family protein, partial [Streptomyces sp. NPDC096068]|uniref:EsaB/YukD family protein n=1 Tax=Streptomyces sp. NPDC096068 TaxID=3155424 RepID=UPI0033325BDD